MPVECALGGLCAVAVAQSECELHKWLDDLLSLRTPIVVPFRWLLRIIDTTAPVYETLNIPVIRHPNVAGTCVCIKRMPLNQI